MPFWLDSLFCCGETQRKAVALSHLILQKSNWHVQCYVALPNALSHMYTDSTHSKLFFKRKLIEKYLCSDKLPSCVWMRGPCMQENVHF